jgi:hypothetical protein
MTPAVEPADPSWRSRRYGRLAGALFIVGAVATVPSSLLLEPEPPDAMFVLAGVAVACGVVCLLVPWERLSTAWLHVVPLAATVLVAAAMEIGHLSYGFLLVFVAVFAAYAFPDTRHLVAHLALMSATLLLAPLYESELAREAVRNALIAVPTLALTAGTVHYINGQLERRERHARALATEAIEISTRLRRDQ